MAPRERWPVVVRPGKCEHNTIVHNAGYIVYAIRICVYTSVQNFTEFEGEAEPCSGPGESGLHHTRARERALIRETIHNQQGEQTRALACALMLRPFA